MVCATCQASNQSAHTRSLTRAFVCRLTLLAITYRGSNTFNKRPCWRIQQSWSLKIDPNVHALCMAAVKAVASTGIGADSPHPSLLINAIHIDIQS